MLVAASVIQPAIGSSGCVVLQSAATATQPSWPRTTSRSPLGRALPHIGSPVARAGGSAGCTPARGRCLTRHSPAVSARVGRLAWSSPPTTSSAASSALSQVMMSPTHSPPRSPTTYVRHGCVDKPGYLVGGGRAPTPGAPQPTQLVSASQQAAEALLRVRRMTSPAPSPCSVLSPSPIRKSSSTMRLTTPSQLPELLTQLGSRPQCAVSSTSQCPRDSIVRWLPTVIQTPPVEAVTNPRRLSFGDSLMASVHHPQIRSLPHVVEVASASGSPSDSMRLSSPSAPSQSPSRWASPLVVSPMAAGPGRPVAAASSGASPAVGGSCRQVCRAVTPQAPVDRGTHRCNSKTGSAIVPIIGQPLGDESKSGRSVITESFAVEGLPVPEEPSSLPPSPEGEPTEPGSESLRAPSQERLEENNSPPGPLLVGLAPLIALDCNASKAGTADWRSDVVTLRRAWTLDDAEAAAGRCVDPTTFLKSTTSVAGCEVPGCMTVTSAATFRSVRGAWQCSDTAAAIVGVTGSPVQLAQTPAVAAPADAAAGAARRPEATTKCGKPDVASSRDPLSLAARLQQAVPREVRRHAGGPVASRAALQKLLSIVQDLEQFIDGLIQLRLGEQEALERQRGALVSVAES